MPKLQPITITLTIHQIKWLKQHSDKTGLPRVEIIRRAVDTYEEAEELKEQRRYFTPDQRQSIRDISRRSGLGEIEVVREAVNKEVRFRKKLYEKRSNQ